MAAAVTRCPQEEHVSDGRALRWGAEAPDDADAARDRLLDAAEQCLARWGPAKTTLADIAAEAGVSRTTVYRHLGSRTDLLVAMTLRRMERGQRTVDELFADLPFAERLAELLLRGRDWVRSLDQPELARQFATDPALVEASRRNYRAWLGRVAARGELRSDVELDELVEWVVFIRAAIWSDTVSDRDALRGLLVRFAAPAIAAR